MKEGGSVALTSWLCPWLSRHRIDRASCTLPGFGGRYSNTGAFGAILTNYNFFKAPIYLLFLDTLPIRSH